MDRQLVLLEHTVAMHCKEQEVAAANTVEKYNIHFHS